MNLLTKVKNDHNNIEYMLRKLMYETREEITKKNLVDELFEEIKEHIQAEKLCIVEMMLEEKSLSQADKQKTLEVVFCELCSKIDFFIKEKITESDLLNFKKILKTHIKQSENIIDSFSKKHVSHQKSEDLGLKFDQEKTKTLIDTITYA